jgi:hypothetical protein
VELNRSGALLGAVNADANKLLTAPLATAASEYPIARGSAGCFVDP